MARKKESTALPEAKAPGAIAKDGATEPTKLSTAKPAATEQDAENLANAAFAEFNDEVGVGDSDEPNEGQGASDNEDEPTNEADEGDEPQGEGAQADDDEATDDEGDDDGPYEVDETDLDRTFRFKDGSVLSLRELALGHKNQFPREAWLKKTNELANVRKQYETATQSLGQLAQLIDTPHEFVAQYLAGKVQAGTLDRSIYDVINKAWTGEAKAGRYNAEAIAAKSQTLRQQAEIARQGKELQEQRISHLVKTELPELTRRYGQQSNETLDTVAQYADQVYRETGQIVGPLAAFQELVRQKVVTAKPVAPPSPRKRADQLRNTPIRRPGVGTKQTNDSSLLDQARAAMRELQG